MSLCYLAAAIFLLSLAASVSRDISTLKLVNVVYRHGDRSPVETFPTDTYQESAWPNGWGWLSERGMRQHYWLGQYLRRRYLESGFMNMSYSHNEITVLSSDVNRTLQSAYCDLAGMYPPDPNTVWRQNMTWQPIPVHTRPEDFDYLIAMNAKCPAYDRAYKANLQTDTVKQEEKENKAFYDFIIENTGVKYEDVQDIWKVFDPIACERYHDMPLDSWINDTVFDKLSELEGMALYLLYNNTAGRYKGGPLIKDFIKNMNGRIHGNMHPDAKMFVYSGHDTTLAAVLVNLNLYNNIAPTYATCVMVELHEHSTGQFFVEIYYRNTSDEHAVEDQLTMPGCTPSCPLPKFIELTKSKILPGDWLKECAEDNSLHLSAVSIVVIGVCGGIVLAIILVTTVFCCWKQKKMKNYSILCSS